MDNVWRQLGTVFRPEKRFSWMQTHAQLPVAVPLPNGHCRVYFASRDERNCSSVGFVDVELPEFRVLRVSERPVLSCGPLGCFDDHGVYPASIVEHDGRLWMYYIGWNPGPRPPLFYSSIGLAFSEDGGESFQRLQPSPILARSPHDPCLVTSPCVLKIGDLWRMWYVSGFRWERVRVGEGGEELQSYYHIKYAESDDGLNWRREGRVCIDLDEGERNIARPCVVRERDGYGMWYSFNRGEGYRVGYAESPDGLTWNRQDAAVRFGDAEFPETESVRAYPWVFEAGGSRYLLYNGESYGRDGFCAAVAVQKPGFSPATLSSRRLKAETPDAEAGLFDAA